MKKAIIRKNTKKIVFLEVEEKKHISGVWDALYSAFNQSRCKTALLIGSILCWSAFVITEIIGNPSTPIQQASAGFFIYWTGRHSKSQENRMTCDKKLLSSMED